MIKNSDHIVLNFVSNLKFTNFSVLVLSHLNNSLKISEDEIFKIEMSLREAINNAIIHGNKSNINKRVSVRFNWNKSTLTIRVKDESRIKVNFKKINKELENKDILDSHGRGILIIKTYMDNVRFNATNKGSEIIMEKNI